MPAICCVRPEPEGHSGKIIGHDEADCAFGTIPEGWPTSSAVYAGSMVTERFDIESGPDGTWSVIDIKTGLPYQEVA
ncbi:hypothetical protein [Mesorhizobium sp. WSM2561]|uniref:hypothetical protein n=1 Tax=Mesorhizobium sp. WSM2561 TaxID=1040985 RepID=UPI0012EC8A63|nr:hypothetical protein [Mesorhizobium sp. WSM2561]